MEKILRIKDVAQSVGLGKTTIWQRIREGQFPRPVRLGGPGSRAVGWRQGDIERWLSEREVA